MSLKSNVLPWMKHQAAETSVHNLVSRHGHEEGATKGKGSEATVVLKQFLERKGVPFQQIEEFLKSNKRKACTIS